jgi:RHS repeat-associated protein
MNGRSFSNEGYRFGFNGMERDNETFPDAYDFGARILDTRLGRWLSVDPLFHMYTSFSPFCYVLNNPIILTDVDGKFVKDKDGNIIFVLASRDKLARLPTSISQPGTKTHIEAEEIINSDGIKIKEVFTEFRYSGVEGFILDDKGQKIPAILVEDATVTVVKVTRTYNAILNSTEETVEDVQLSEDDQIYMNQLDATSNCTGKSLINHKLVVFSNEITNSVVQNENIRILDDDDKPQAGDIGVYKEGDRIVHFVEYTGPTTVETKGGVTKATVLPAGSPEIWASPMETNSIYEVWRKDAINTIVENVSSKMDSDPNGINVISKKEGKKIQKDIKKNN